MNPIDPKVEGVATVMVGAGRSDVEGLPAANVEGCWYTVWELTEGERARVAAGARIELWITHYGRPISPVSLSVETRPGICRVCGCTDELACDEGCSWREPDFCSACGSETAS